MGAPPEPEPESASSLLFGSGTSPPRTNSISIGCPSAFMRRRKTPLTGSLEPTDRARNTMTPFRFTAGWLKLPNIRSLPGMTSDDDAMVRHGGSSAILPPPACATTPTPRHATDAMPTRKVFVQFISRSLRQRIKREDDHAVLPLPPQSRGCENVGVRAAQVRAENSCKGAAMRTHQLGPTAAGLDPRPPSWTHGRRLGPTAAGLDPRPPSASTADSSPPPSPSQSRVCRLFPRESRVQNSARDAHLARPPRQDIRTCSSSSH